MCTYYRQLKNGNIQEFVFELDRNKYELVNFPPEFEFHFTIYDNHVAFTINVDEYKNKGYGTALISIMFEIIEIFYPEIEIIYGWLSTSDYYDYGNNWERSIPFYLHQKENAFLIKTSRKLHLIYNTEDVKEVFRKKYYSYKDFIADGIEDGYIIYQMGTYRM